MSDPVKELIAANIKTTIDAITVGNGFNQTLTAVRPKRVDFQTTFDDLTALVNAVEAAVVPGGNNCTRWLQFFVITVIVIDSDDSTTTIDTRLNQVSADIEKKLMEDHTRGGNAIDTHIVESSPFEPDDSGPGGIAVKFSVDYRTKIEDPYTRI